MISDTLYVFNEYLSNEFNHIMKRYYLQKSKYQISQMSNKVEPTFQISKVSKDNDINFSGILYLHIKIQSILKSKRRLFVTPMDYTVHGILQARILEWVAVLFSRGSSQPRDQTLGLPHCRQILYQLSHHRKVDHTVISEKYFWVHFKTEFSL